MQRIAILGFAREGKSVLKFIKKLPEYKNAEIKILDRKLDKNYLKKLGDFDIVFRSPGVPYNLPEIRRALKNGVEFSSATKLFFEYVAPILRRGSGQVIGITGTKGKGTTSTLLYQILKKSGKNAYLAGNIGKPALDILPRLSASSQRKSATTIVILELSSFQLQDLRQSPKIAAVLDVFPDHLDAHKNLEEYLEAKSNIALYQKPGDKIFYFPDNKFSSQVARGGWGKKIPVNAFNLKNLPPLKIPGRHNAKNALMAMTIAKELGCPENKIIAAVKNFRGLEHRLEFVRSIKTPIKNHSHVLKNMRMDFFNDSASTNPQTAAAAVLSFSNTLDPKPYPLILIAGGKDKNLDYKPLAEAIRKSGNVKLVILIGENKGKINRELRIMNKELRITMVKNLNAAVVSAYKISKSSMIHDSKFIILFSPGAASFDMFKDYADRGEKFKKIVKNLKIR